jgi:hypothetical protein
MYVEDSGQFAGNIFAVSIYSNAENPDSEDYFEENAVEFEQMRSHEYAWNTHAFIDASTATLSITLTHLLQIKPIVTLSSQTEDRTTFSVQTKSCGLYICTEPISVDAIVHSESDHLFLLHSQDQETGLLFIMRQTATPRTFRLMLCCACYDVALFYKHLPGHPHYNVPEYMYNKKYAGSYSVMLHGSLYTALEQARTLSNLEFGPKETCRRELDFLREMFPGKTFTIMDILPTIQGLLNKATGLSPGFQEAYSRQLIETLPAYHPYVKDDFVELRFDPEQWTSVHDCFSSSKALTRWRWRHDSHAPWSNDRFSMVDTSRPVYLRGNLRYIYKSFLYGSIFDIMLRVRSFSHITLEDEITMIKRGPKVEDKLVFDDAWPRVAVEELGLDGTPWQVNIS